MGLPYSLPAGLPYSLQAGLLLPRTAADSGEPRTTAGRFWLGPGHSPDTGGSLPSILVQWCLGGPRTMGIGPVPEQREDGGVIEARRRGEPAEFPGVLGEREITAGKGDE